MINPDAPEATNRKTTSDALALLVVFVLGAVFLFGLLDKPSGAISLGCIFGGLALLSGFCFYRARKIKSGLLRGEYYALTVVALLEAVLLGVGMTASPSGPPSARARLIDSAFTSLLLAHSFLVLALIITTFARGAVGNDETPERKE